MLSHPKSVEKEKRQQTPLFASCGHSGGWVGRQGLTIGPELNSLSISSTWMEGNSNCRQKTTKQRTMQMEQVAQFKWIWTQNKYNYIRANNSAFLLNARRRLQCQFTALRCNYTNRYKKVKCKWNQKYKYSKTFPLFESREIREPQSSYSILCDCLRPPTRVSLPLVLGMRQFVFLYLHLYLYLMLSPPFYSGQFTWSVGLRQLDVFTFWIFVDRSLWMKKCEAWYTWVSNMLPNKLRCRISLFARLWPGGQ